MMTRRLAGLFIFTSAWACGQATEARAEFEVADIKLNKSNQPGGMGTILPGGQFRAINIPVAEIIKFAYNLRRDAILGGPRWMDNEYYNIVGKGPAVGSEEIFWRSDTATFFLKFSYNWDDVFRAM